MHFGDLIKGFMNKMAQHSRKHGIFVVLSRKYLRSPFCMYELHEIFRACGQNEGEFARRVRVWALPDAKIWTPEDRARIAAQWKRRLDKLSASIDRKGRIVSGWKALLEERIMTEFAHNTADIIACIAGTLNPTRIEDIEALRFEELIPLV
jgi:internalin A